MVLTQYEAGDLDGRLRTFTTMGQVAIWASLASLTGGGWQLPVDAAGWLGLGLLTFFYGTAFTLMFTVLPRLGVVGNSAIMNVEPVFALVLAWAFLNQAIAPVWQASGASMPAILSFTDSRCPCGTSTTVSPSITQLTQPCSKACAGSTRQASSKALTRACGFGFMGRRQFPGPMHQGLSGGLGIASVERRALHCGADGHVLSALLPIFRRIP